MKIIFKKPFNFEGKDYMDLDLDMDALTGRDLINANKEAVALGDASPVNEFSKTYLAAVAAKAAKVPVDMILSLPASDFTSLTLQVQNFLFGMESGVVEQSKNSEKLVC
ncbi:hypothetical protein Dred_1214 [Desulforamulus reducens MI-1]|uniref:Phage tail assembly protein n=1 Tax=Desulforamulus reducens (strain ATCC BAA-1160 / DSM 100696 / MI-1) TaxID=349161 RepID=A4J3U5_DESRM|nr:phage tail assembly protein [Desulforamulus reducens]ABO49748.1 hypothetical protein Dred_1214 [Desulforamulus reducens MI-1]